MITYISHIDPLYLELVFSIWREYKMACPIVVFADKASDIVIKIGPITGEKAEEMADKIWHMTGGIRMIGEKEEQPVHDKNF
ncbi:hypothetical protein [Bacteroides thetaiotaomicron]|uniref:hypothetical protein n=1 Tax=Bacteroides thetaiotaomicron TaxID=818 RepID=UPI0011C3BA60|nr:hypothetical protein [Bacteroides thetaiotaomicron]